MSWDRLPLPAPQPLAEPAAIQPWAKAPDLEEREHNGGYTLAEIDAVLDDPELWARLHGFVPDRVTKEPVPLIPSPLQGRMFRHYRYCQENDVPCRIVAVKIRRGGGSTGSQWNGHCHVTNHRAKFGTIGTDEEVSMNMFEMARMFDTTDQMPGYRRAIKTLETGELSWANGSTWNKYTAQKPEAARSAGLQGYHATEVGRWPDGGVMDAKETLKSMLGAVPRHGFTYVCEESTARGAKGAFYERFKNGRWPTAEELGCEPGKEYWRKWESEFPQNIAGSETERKLQFVRVFSAWFEDDENRSSDVSEADADYIRSTLDTREQELLSRYLTVNTVGEVLGGNARLATVWQQLAWRRAVIATEFEGDVDGFAQENPSGPAEAFAASGRHSFNRAGCAWMVECSRSRASEIGVLERQHDGGVVFRRTPMNEAWVQMWQEPREGYSYLAALDTCGGKSNVRDPDYCDYNAGLVMRAPHIAQPSGERKAGMIVMSLMPKNQLDPDVLADRMHLVSDFYGRCLVVFEVNNTGAAFRQEAKLRGMNLYREEVLDKFTSERTEYIGWTTTKESRVQLIGALKKHIRNNSRPETRADGVECYCITLAQECQDMILDDDQVDRAPGRKHDDHVLALGMALVCVNGATYYRGKSRRRPIDRNPGWTKLHR